MERPSRCGEKRTAVWPSHHEERGSDGAVSPHVCGHRVVPDRGVVPDRCNSAGSAMDACRDATAEADELSARQMAVLCTFREPSLCRHVHCEFMRNALLDLTPIIPATACHQRNDVETYSRYWTLAKITY